MTADHVPPIAASVRLYRCEDKGCRVVHVLLMSESKTPLAQCTMDVEIVRKLQDILYQQAAESEE